MEFHKGTAWNPKTKLYIGSIDYGTAIPKPADDLPAEGLVLIIVGIKEHWKYHIVYVLQDKCMTAVQEQLIKGFLALFTLEG